MHSIGKTLQNELSLKPEVKLDLQGHNVMTNKSSSEGKSENDKEVKLRGVINCMIDQVSELYVKMEIDHNEQLYHFIDHAIEVVLAEQQDKDGHFEDPIDLKVRQDIVEENYIKCAACGTLNSKRKQKCTGCDEREGNSQFSNGNSEEQCRFTEKFKIHDQGTIPWQKPPKYQKIELYDTIQDRMMPDNVRELNDLYASITTSGNPSAGEDLDFSTKYVSRPLGIEDAITAYRTCLRRSNYLNKEKDHTSISGMALDEGLVNFVHEATKKRIVMLRTEFLGEIFEEQSTFKHPLPQSGHLANSIILWNWLNLTAL
ncbi:unnamed protein product [Mytilus edulis]|uniref:Uncharacterized protein n=1 Tax=Mytilus edulis TaxID=6550 RepID=A0A8S3VB06_MYTED|nr:unnamed protein product [Mytilus edulis]